MAKALHPGGGCENQGENRTYAIPGGTAPIPPAARPAGDRARQPRKRREDGRPAAAAALAPRASARSGAAP